SSRWDAGGPACRPSGRLRWEHREDPDDERLELLHEVPEELGRGVVGDLAGVGEQAGLELDVGLWGVHLWGVAEAQDAAQVLLRDRGADGADRRADHCRRLVGEGVLAPR